MRDSKLIELIKTFDKKDWREATSYMKKSLKETSREIILFNYIKRWKDDLASSKLEIKTIWKSLFPNITLQSFYRSFNSLSSYMKRFIALKDLEDPGNHLEYDLMLARAYKKRGLNEQFASKIRSLEKKISQSNSIDIWKNIYLTRLYYEYYFSDIQDKSLIEKDVLKKAINTFEVFTDLLNLVYLIEIVDRSDLNDEDWNKERAFLLEKKKNIKKKESVRLLLDLFEAVKNKNKESENEINYLKLKSKLGEYRNVLSADLFYFLSVKIFNLNVRLKKQGVVGYEKDIMDIYDFRSKSDILTKNKSLSEAKFLNIIANLCALGEVDQIQIFMEKWSKNLVTNHHNEVMVLAEAHLVFAQKEPKKVLEILDAMPFRKTRLFLRANWLKLCCLYETYEFDDEFKTEKLIYNFTRYLRKNKNKIRKRDRKSSENLLRVIKLLLKDDGSKGSKEKIRAFVKSCGHLVFRSWIESKI